MKFLEVGVITFTVPGKALPSRLASGSAPLKCGLYIHKLVPDNVSVSDLKYDFLKAEGVNV